MKFIVLLYIHLGGKCKISWSNDDLERFYKSGPWQIGFNAQECWDTVQIFSFLHYDALPKMQSECMSNGVKWGHTGSDGFRWVQTGQTGSIGV